MEHHEHAECCGQQLPLPGDGLGGLCSMRTVSAMPFGSSRPPSANAAMRQSVIMDSRSAWESGAIMAVLPSTIGLRLHCPGSDASRQ